MTGGHSWQNRWFVLEVTTDAGAEEGSVVRTAMLTYHHSQNEKKDGQQIPLWEALGVRGSVSKTKGTEHRLTIKTASREWDLGTPDEEAAKEWTDLLIQWVGLPKVERVQPATSGEGSSALVVKAQWMEVRVDAHKPDAGIEDLSRSYTVSQSMTRSGSTMRGRRKREEDPKVPGSVTSSLPEDEEVSTFAETAASHAEEEDEDDEDDE
uniref:PH domain-containing protein n=1 Tax=Haptolina ericina TaxID=156174 RepID=A0A7S3EYE7_9EUKA